MRISVFGLGYVGTVTCGCLATEGNSVIGVDVSKLKVDMINKGESPVIEPDIGNIIKVNSCNGRLTATIDAGEAIAFSDISFISVGTPSKSNGSIQLDYIQTVCSQIGLALSNKHTYHIVVVRSTVLPGTSRKVIIPILEELSGKKEGVDFGVCFNPEFLREGSSVKDYYDPPKTVIGSLDDRPAQVLCELYKNLRGQVFLTSLDIAEMIKYADNSFHAVKITFANEIGMICKALGIDSHVVMDIFCKDRKLNISSYYLTPGFAFGGSCLPKDVNALAYLAKKMDINTPLLQSLSASNDNQIATVVESILITERMNVGVLGFSFKAGTDDLRSSPMVEVIETLIGKGRRVRVYDRSVNLSRLIGANQSYIEQKIPHIAALMCESIDEVISQSDIILIGNKAEEFQDITNEMVGDKLVFDLVRIELNKYAKGNYIGLAW